MAGDQYKQMIWGDFWSRARSHDITSVLNSRAQTVEKMSVQTSEKSPNLTKKLWCCLKWIFIELINVALVRLSPQDAIPSITWHQLLCIFRIGKDAAAERQAKRKCKGKEGAKERVRWKQREGLQRWWLLLISTSKQSLISQYLKHFSSSHPGRLFRATCDARLLSHKTQDDPYGRNVNCVIRKIGGDVCYKVLSKETPFFLPLIEMFWLKQPSLSTMPPFVCAYCYCLHFYTAVIYYLLEKLYLYFCQ